jgi:hypothetical protein
MMSRDKAYQDLVESTVLMIMTDGTALTGALHHPRAKTLLEYMNYDSRFIEIERKDGTRVDIAKHAIRSIEVTDNPRTDQLHRAMGQLDTLEPYQVLGIPRGAPREVIREAYLKMQRQYHPDRYTGQELPTEVAEYINAMSRKVNIAYSMLSERGRQAN